MKRFFSVVSSIKTRVCVNFTAYLCVAFVVAIGFGQWEQVKWPFSLLLAACLFGVMQWVCYGDVCLKAWRYSLRTLLFLGVTLPGLLLLAWGFGWFPMDQPLAWAIFLVLFAAVFAATMFLFELAFQAKGRQYDGLLGEYKAKKAQNRR